MLNAVSTRGMEGAPGLRQAGWGLTCTQGVEKLQGWPGAGPPVGSELGQMACLDGPLNHDRSSLVNPSKVQMLHLSPSPGTHHDESERWALLLSA